MRICLHTIREIERTPVGGTERFLTCLASELNELGHDSFILCSGMKSSFEIDGIVIHSLIPEPYRQAYIKSGFANSNFLINEIAGGEVSIRALKRLSEYTESQLREVTFDIAHLNSFASSLFLSNPERMVITNHENGFEYDSRWGTGFTRFFEELVCTRETSLHKAGCLTTPSRHYAKVFSDLLDTPVSSIGGGIKLSTFDRAPIRNRKTNHGSNRPDGKLFVLMPSRFDPHQKGHDVALLACSHLKDWGVHAIFQFSGIRNDYEDRLKSFYDSANALGVGDRVAVTRYDQIQDAYEQCDVAISPERYCSYGLSISETLSLGIPTVLSDIPTYLEIAGGFQHALFFESENSINLALQIVQASKLDDALRESEAVRFRINYDIRNVAKGLDGIYNRIIQKSIDPD